MNKTILGGLGALFLLTSVATAQVVTANTDKAQRFETLEASYEKAKAEYVAKRTAITKSEEYQKLRKARDFTAIRALMSELKSPDADFYPRFEALAKANAGKKGEVEILLWMLGHNRDKTKNAATIETLAGRDIKGDFWASRLRLVSYYLGSEKGGVLLTRLSKEHPDLAVRQVARQTRANAIIRSSEKELSAAKKALSAAKADLDDLIAKFPDSIPALQKGGPEFITTRLQIGMQAPEILAKDLDGNDIKLSDYIGRVVVIDFWGDW